MQDLLRRFASLPRELRDGRWTQCSAYAVGGCIRFRETRQTALRRRRWHLRRRLALGAAGLTLMLLGHRAFESGLGLLALLVGSVLALRALDRLAHDLPRPEAGLEYAVLDGRRELVQIISPAGLRFSVPSHEIAAVAVLVEPQRPAYHLALLTGDGQVLPWLTSRFDGPARNLAWVLGYLLDRPAVLLPADGPPPTNPVAEGQLIPGPTPPSDSAG